MSGDYCVGDWVFFLLGRMEKDNCYIGSVIGQFQQEIPKNKFRKLKNFRNSDV